VKVVGTVECLPLPQLLFLIQLRVLVATTSALLIFGVVEVLGLAVLLNELSLS
jgi:hypothetical protein